jgi:hypothetical protein
MRRGGVLAAVALCAVLGMGATAHAAPLDLGSCGAKEDVYQCSGLAKTWDGVPLDTTVTLPAAGAAHLPLVVEINGFGNSKYEYLDPESKAYTDNAYGWAKAGYAVLTYTARGLWGSCGTPESRLANPDACARGYIHLADTRYEVRDAQYLIGLLVDEGVADPDRIGATGTPTAAARRWPSPPCGTGSCCRTAAWCRGAPRPARRCGSPRRRR